MKEEPFFSIIIPTYNRAELLKKAIESVCGQSFQNWELLIVDDGSTDHTKEVVAGFSDSRIRYIYQNNAERSAARNNGIEQSQGKYVCFLDSDDYFLADRLQKLYDEILNNKEPIAFFYTGILYQRGEKITPKPENKYTAGSIYDFVARAIIGTPQVCIARPILYKHRFNPLFHIGEDMELWLRVVEDYPLIFLNDQETVVAVEHDERSVNFGRYNSFEHQLRMLRHVFSPGHPGRNISRAHKSFLLSGAYHGIAGYYINHENRWKATLFMFRAIFADLFSKWTKLRVNILLKLLLFKPFSAVRQLINY